MAQEGGEGAGIPGRGTLPTRQKFTRKGVAWFLGSIAENLLERHLIASFIFDPLCLVLSGGDSCYLAQSGLSKRFKVGVTETEGSHCFINITLVMAVWGSVRLEARRPAKTEAGLAGVRRRSEISKGRTKIWKLRPEVRGRVPCQSYRKR